MGGVDVDVAFEALDVDALVKFVLVIFCGDGQLGDFLWGLVSGD